MGRPSSPDNNGLCGRNYVIPLLKSCRGQSSCLLHHLYKHPRKCVLPRASRHTQKNPPPPTTEVCEPFSSESEVPTRNSSQQEWQSPLVRVCTWTWTQTDNAIDLFGKALFLIATSNKSISHLTFFLQFRSFYYQILNCR